MTNALRSNVQQLASAFASAVVTAIRNANLDDILAIAGGSSAAVAPKRLGRPPSNPQPAHAAPVTATGPRRSEGRLARRSPGDIAKSLAQVVALVKGNKAGLRAEQIRDALDMEAKEMPRILKEGLTSKVLKSQGQKRATTYFAS